MTSSPSPYSGLLFVLFIHGLAGPRLSHINTRQMKGHSGSSMKKETETNYTKASRHPYYAIFEDVWVARKKQKKQKKKKKKKKKEKKRKKRKKKKK